MAAAQTSGQLTALKLHWADLGMAKSNPTKYEFFPELARPWFSPILHGSGATRSITSGGNQREWMIGSALGHQDALKKQSSEANG